MRTSQRSPCFHTLSLDGKKECVEWFAQGTVWFAFPPCSSRRPDVGALQSDRRTRAAVIEPMAAARAGVGQPWRPQRRHVEPVWWEGERLLGFVGCLRVRGVAGAGRHRSPGRSPRIGSALLDAAVPLCRERGDGRPLLVSAAPSIAGQRAGTEPRREALDRRAPSCPVRRADQRTAQAGQWPLRQRPSRTCHS